MSDKVEYKSGKITVGNFTFGLDGWAVTNAWNWFWNKEDMSKEYEDLAIELMSLHQEFYGQFRKIEEYVTSGAWVICDKGTVQFQMGLRLDHGVLSANGQPLLTCKDCKFDHFADGGFGYCEIDHSVFKIPKVEKSTVMIEKPHCCFPILEEEWRQAESDIAVAVDLEGEEFVDALRSGAYLTCMYGGRITIVDIPDKPEEEKKEEVKIERKENEKIGGRLEKKKKEEIWISPWLCAYKGVPTRTGGTRIEDLKSEEREKLKQENREKMNIDGVDWYSYESEINAYVDDQYEAAGKIDEFAPVFDDKDAYVNNLEEHRYWVAVGPEVLSPGYNTNYPEEEQDLNESQFKYGTEIDVVLEYIGEDEDRETGERVYIECIVGDVKAHTYPYGLFQSGIAYPESNDEDDLTKKDGSYIEFCSDRQEGNNGTMSDYVVVDIIVYEREW